MLTQCPPPPLPCLSGAYISSLLHKQQLAGTGGRVNGHARNRQNGRQQYRENRSAHVATIGALLCVPIYARLRIFIQLPTT